ncbi:AAA family ATPase [Actinomyces oris]|uniref:AAA family ATPase n=1 Tax=Actinomyces oris TaxID=544580 RepID=A0AAW9KTK4_9ACTO|nr:AAA family ATPase [Actinomyces oris]MEA1303917.1 AAA family ATPase [Actinomyces oris]
MYFKSLTITNFKSFEGEQPIIFSKGINYIVGNNNCGKSTIIDALRYLAEGTRDTSALQNKSTSEDFSVEAIIAGEELSQIVEDRKYSKLKDYLLLNEDGHYFKVRHSPKEEEIEQNGKKVKLDGKKITLWNPDTQRFENPTGIDALFRSLVDLVPVLADTTTSEVVDFGTTKPLGRLIAAVSQKFQETDRWTAFQKAHTEAFSDGEESLSSLTENVTSQVERLVQAQYGAAKVRLDFDLPDATTFIKGGQLLVTDGNYETPLCDKGTGMQRAVTLALIQVYSNIQHKTKEHAPLTLLLDEPETWLHPRAQIQLGEALAKISEDEQLFLITHSPYMLRSYRPAQHKLLIFSRENNVPSIQYSDELGLLTNQKPSLGEITYFAFGISSPEFHDELWGEIHCRIDPGSESGLNKALNEKYGFDYKKTWIREGKNGLRSESATISYYIRSSSHHPENRHNKPYTDDELEESTESLIAVLKALQSTHTNTP